jgi:hypothetical protein
MSAGFYIVPERESEGIDVFVSGKSLAPFDGLDEVAAACGVRPLMDFFSQDPAELAEFLEDADADLPDEALPSEQWFAAEDGLATIRGLVAGLSVESGSAEDLDCVLQELQEFESVLRQLASNNIRWHLGVDY